MVGARRAGEALRAAAASLVLACAAPLAAGAAPPAPGDARAPQRIVSLNVCIDQLLLALVDRTRIAALTYHSTDPTFTNTPEAARGLHQSHGRAEEILPLAPDLVIGGEYSTVDTISLLRRVGVRVEVMKLANSLPDVRANIRWLGALVGAAAGAEAMIADLDRRLAAAVRDLTAGPRPVLAFYTTNGFTAAPGTLADDAIRAAGYENFARVLGLGPDGRLNLEVLATRRIDALALVDESGASHSRARESLAHPALRRLMARIPHAALPARLWLCETPFIAEAVERLAALRRAAPGGPRR